MSDIIFIRELRLHTVIGVYGWERDVRQELLLDLEMAWDTRGASESDNVEDALNYAAVAERVQEFAAANAFQLLEKMAGEIAALLMAEYSLPWLRLRLCKPGAVSDARDVGVLIERGQRPA